MRVERVEEPVFSAANHLARLAGAGLVAAAPGGRCRVRYRVRSAPMQRCCNNKERQEKEDKQ